MTIKLTMEQLAALPLWDACAYRLREAGCSEENIRAQIEKAQLGMTKIDAANVGPSGIEQQLCCTGGDL